MNHLGDTLNFDSRMIDFMAENPTDKANEIGRRLPYHLQYIKDGKPNIKPVEKKKMCNETMV